jgi:hypothetical protein
MLRENTDESILCLCYTNHALDQFLGHMLDAGETSLVRIGSRSRSERVASYNLKELARQKSQQLSSCGFGRSFKRVEAQMHAIKTEIEKHLSGINKPLQWRGEVENYLQDEEPELFACLYMPTLGGNFQFVGPNGKSVPSDYLWNCWYGGKAFPEFVLDIMESDNLPRFQEFWSMAPADRIAMANQWRADIIEEDINELISRVNEFEMLCDERRAIRHEQNLEIVKQARVIGATTTGAAQNKELLSSKKPGILIVEEAGEVLEAHVLSALQADSTKHLILIGDHMQLRPKVESYHLTVVSDMGYSLDCSLFERLVLAGLPSVTLEVQHRMRPTISELIRMQTYPDLVDHNSVKTFPDLRGVERNVVFIDHRYPEDIADNDDEDIPSMSKSNNYEVGMVVAIAKYFLHQGYRPDRIAILTPYLCQLQQIVRRVKGELKEVAVFLGDRDSRDLEELEGKELTEEQRSFDIKSLRCSSIDNFQGEEADIVIISLVRSNKKGQIGFLKEAQRVNVLLSRARLGMFIVGNSKTLRTSDRGRQVWDPIIQSFESNGSLMEGIPTHCQLHPEDKPIVMSKTEDFLRHRANGGCSRLCGRRMNCGHHCRLTCHPFDREHNNLAGECIQPCRRIPSKCNEGHACKKLCKENCGPCGLKKGPFQLMNCDHWLDSVFCHDVRDETAILSLSRKCTEEVTHKFEPCGHEAKTSCANTKLDKPLCPSKCNQSVEGCGHVCATICSKCDGKHLCNRFCQRNLFCGHLCATKCHSGVCQPCTQPCIVSCVHSKCPKLCRELCSSCVEPCDWQCDHQGKCNLVCGAPCARMPCSEVSKLRSVPIGWFCSLLLNLHP